MLVVWPVESSRDNYVNIVGSLGFPVPKKIFLLFSFPVYCCCLLYILCLFPVPRTKGTK